MNTINHKGGTKIIQKYLTRQKLDKNERIKNTWLIQEKAKKSKDKRWDK